MYRGKWRPLPKYCMCSICTCDWLNNASIQILKPKIEPTNRDICYGGRVRIHDVFIPLCAFHCSVLKSRSTSRFFRKLCMYCNVPWSTMIIYENPHAFCSLCKLAFTLKTFQVRFEENVKIISMEINSNSKSWMDGRYFASTLWMLI